MSNKKRIAILGPTGMLGSMVYNVLKEKYDLVLVLKDKENLSKLDKVYGGVRKHKVFHFDFNFIYQDYLRGFKNLKIAPSFKKFLEGIGEVDAVINCVGIIIPYSLENPAVTFFINSALPHLLSSVFKEKLIHPTTDCVFNGIEGFPYNEKSSHSPTDLYGLSKSLGEPRDSLVFRTSFFGPEIKSFVSLLEWFKKQNGKKIRGFRRHFWNGITTKEFGRICDKIIKEREKYPRAGIFHIFSTTLSKYEMLLKFREKYNIDCEIVPDDSSEINRTLSTIYPLCSQLKIPSFDEMLKEL